jgi:hypothetical protein
MNCWDPQATAPIRLATETDLPEPSGTYFDEKASAKPLPKATTHQRHVNRAWELGERLATTAPTATSGGGRPAKKAC